MTKKQSTKKSRQLVISIPEISKAGVHFLKKASEVAKQSKLTIRLEKG